MDNSIAKELPWSSKPYTHFSDQEPLRDFLEALAASQKTPIVISEKIEVVVSGYYKKMIPRDIFGEVAKANGLVWYYDGNTLYINREDEMQTGSVSLKYATPTGFTHALERLGVLDHHYHWVASDVDRMIYFKGPEQFVTAVLEMSKALDKKQDKPSVYRWVDDNGITNFSTSLPSEYNSSFEVNIGKKNKGVVALGKSEYQ